MDPAPQAPDAPAAIPADAHSLRVLAVEQQLRIVYRAMQAYSRGVERQCGVSAAQLWALRELARQPGLRVSQLSQALSLHQSTTSNLLDKLEKKALVARRRGGPDQRTVRVELTDAGRQILGRAPRQGTLNDALRRLPEAVVAELEHGLRAMVAVMADAGGGLFQPAARDSRIDSIREE
ncbi:MarR family transcriptional regulator [Thiohalobacter sp. IOR34]|uniref:MarR family winged helix-turn-helix transcriptional regulator n=1 Tax=Thiohalobacter sp. IOR34 TaxID=3057176 RepID=UPI0025B0DB08|nr:MarR family transcriptional regulator [Thiohalobacter sp. IOR34]WJW75472.1 MarR family transcriptional regulator [Thiohalobacter sp. IOR34]